MRIEAFDLAESADNRLGFDATLAIEADDAGASLKHVSSDTGEGFARAAGWQRMAGSSKKIADGDG